MIRIGYMSDIHLEFEVDREFVDDLEWLDLRDRRRAEPGHPEIGPWLGEIKGRIDLMVIAGDIQPGTLGLAYAQAVMRYLYVPVVVVAGNHEFYGHVLAQLRQDLKTQAMALGLHFLDNNSVEFQLQGRNLLILGTTLWTDFDLDGQQDLNLRIAWNRMSDHGDIFLGYQQEFSPRAALAEHQTSVAWLDHELATARDLADRVLVVSHHAPCRAAAPQSGARAGTAWGYASDLEDLLRRHRPDGWIYGHTHEVRSLDVSGVPVVCACRGYVKRGIGWGFRPQILTIGE